LGSHEIVDCAFRDLKLAFLREDRRDIAVRQPAAAQLVYQLAVWFQTRASRFRRYAIQNILEFTFHQQSSNAKFHQNDPKPMLDEGRTNPGQTPDRYRTDKPPSGLRGPKPTGLGMVSSN
jgi:hypothetical protein